MAARKTPSPLKTRRDDGRRYSVFIASPSDVDDYRKGAKEVFEQINAVSMIPTKFSVFMWEDGMRTGYSNSIQQDIFRDAKVQWERDCGYEQCEILVLIFYSKLGQGTKKEYNRFIARFKKHQSDRARLLACVIDTHIPRDSAEVAVELNEFLKVQQNKWKEIGGVRGTIKTVGKYMTDLRHELDMFLNQPSH
jgi:hypothetical protein